MNEGHLIFWLYGNMTPIYEAESGKGRREAGLRGGERGWDETHAVRMSKQAQNFPNEIRFLRLFLFPKKIGISVTVEVWEMTYIFASLSSYSADPLGLSIWLTLCAGKFKRPH